MNEWSRTLGICVAVGAALASTVAGAQRPLAVYGQVVSPFVLPPAMNVELRPLNEVVRTIKSLAPSSVFRVSHSGQGVYSLSILERHGNVNEDVRIANPSQPLAVQLPSSPNATRVREDFVSVHQLSHKIPPEARKAFSKGQAAVRKQNNQDAVKHFRAAVAIDPEFSDAYVELATTLVAVNEPTEAVEQFQKAIDIVPNHETALHNLCITLGKMQRWLEAGDVARRFLRLDPDQPPIRFILGASLALNQGDPTEALDNLLKASAEIPKARLLAADVLRQHGRVPEAVDQLKEYLRTLPPEDADLSKVKYWLMQLQQ